MGRGMGGAGKKHRLEKEKKSLNTGTVVHVNVVVYNMGVTSMYLIQSAVRLSQSICFLHRRESKKEKTKRRMQSVKKKKSSNFVCPSTPPKMDKKKQVPSKFRCSKECFKWLTNCGGWVGGGLGGDNQTRKETN